MTTTDKFDKSRRRGMWATMGNVARDGWPATLRFAFIIVVLAGAVWVASSALDVSAGLTAIPGYLSR